MPKYSVSVICHQGLRMSRGCLLAVLATIPADSELIVTDNGSSDGTAGMIRALAERDPRVRMIHHGRNRGVIGPKNLALEVAAGEYFVSLDNDCIPSPGWIAALSAKIQGKIALVGREGGFRTLSPQGIGIRGKRLDYVDGSCFMVRSDVAREYGLCDEAYEFCYCEDSDFSLRIRKANWAIAVAPAGVQHAEHATARTMNLRRYWEKNHKTFITRWRGYLRTGTFGHPGEPSSWSRSGKTVAGRQSSVS